MSKIGWLRLLITNLVSYPLPDGVWDDKWIADLPIVVGMLVGGDRIVGIKTEAHETLDDLTNAIFSSSPAYGRGFSFERVRRRLR
jgi:hypothetical protein